MESTCLTGHLLIAMPAMEDPNFHRTVTYICEHSQQGALGLVINRPLELKLGMVFEQLALDVASPGAADRPVLQGGPVQPERGFVLHDSPQTYDSTINVGDTIFVTTSQDILAAVAAGHGPARMLFTLGYAGWAAGQLEQEISANAWLSVPASPQIIFETPFEQRWQAAAHLLGVDLANLSGVAGHA